MNGLPTYEYGTGKTNGREKATFLVENTSLDSKNCMRSGMQKIHRATYLKEKVSCICRSNDRKKLSYIGIYNAYKKVLDSLGMKGAYTFGSCRSFYVNERLKEGVEIFTVAKQTGHSMAICNQYYARLNIQSRADEATRRTYGKKKADEGELLF